MAKTKKTTYEERLEIVKWCLDNGRSIKDTAAFFGLSYHQVRSYLIKYEEFGEEGLVDKRGKRKPDEELTELELAQRENKADFTPLFEDLLIYKCLTTAYTYVQKGLDNGSENGENANNTTQHNTTQHNTRQA